MSTLERAICIAAQAHAGQRDKAGAPYILHPLRLMLRMATADEMIAAVLHDVIEDSHVTADDLRREGFSAGVVEAVLALTRRPDEDYAAFVQRAGANPIARRVKLADLEDNMNLLRLATLEERDLERLRRYHRAWQALQDADPRG